MILIPLTSNYKHYFTHSGLVICERHPLTIRGRFSHSNYSKVGASVFKPHRINGQSECFGIYWVPGTLLKCWKLITRTLDTCKSLWTCCILPVNEVLLNQCPRGYQRSENCICSSYCCYPRGLYRLTRERVSCVKGSNVISNPRWSSLIKFIINLYWFENKI